MNPRFACRIAGDPLGVADGDRSFELACLAFVDGLRCEPSVRNFGENEYTKP